MGDDDEGKRPARPKRGKEGQAEQFPMHEHSGKQLKTMCDQMLDEPVPDKLRELLEELERKRPGE